MKIYYSPDYVGSAHSFDTTRKAGWIADSLTTRPIGGVELLAPAATVAGDLARVHDTDYIQAVQTGQSQHLAESQGFQWDPALWPPPRTSSASLPTVGSCRIPDKTAPPASHSQRETKPSAIPYARTVPRYPTTGSRGISRRTV